MNEIQNFSELEEKILQKYLSHNFGKNLIIQNEFDFDGQKIQILKSLPTKKNPYQILVTKGASTRKMNVPEQLAQYKLERAEFIIRLPENWEIDETKSLTEKGNNWPIKLLQNVSTIAFRENGYLCWGKTISNENFAPYASNTNFCGFILVKPIFLRHGLEFCKISKTEDINFYEIIPLYKEEIEFKLENSAEKLLTKLGGFVVLPVNPTRENVCIDDN